MARQMLLDVWHCHQFCFSFSLDVVSKHCHNRNTTTRCHKLIVVLSSNVASKMVALHCLLCQCLLDAWCQDAATTTETLPPMLPVHCFTFFEKCHQSNNRDAARSSMPLLPTQKHCHQCHRLSLSFLNAVLKAMLLHCKVTSAC